MANTEAMHRQLLDVMGVPAEQQDQMIAHQRELATMREEEAEKVANNMRAIADGIAEIWGLPEGMQLGFVLE